MAAFVVTITARDSPLPADTSVTVRYGGGGQEEYRLATPSSSPKVLFCKTVTADGGIVEAGPGEPIEALSCDLWTQGSATLEVRAAAYQDWSEQLLAEELPEGCVGVLTQDKTIELVPLDGGS